MSSPLRWAAGALAAVLAAAAGCCQPPRAQVTLDQLVAEHNANAALAPRIWARARIEATSGLLFTWGSASPAATPNGFLILVKPADPLATPDFTLIGQEADVTVFQAGVSLVDAKYYFWFHGGKAWWGRLALAGAPGITDLPIDPTQLPAATNLLALPSVRSEPAALAMVTPDQPRDYFYDSPLEAIFGPCRYAYVVTHFARQNVSGRLAVKRETCFLRSDSAPPRPFLIRYLDEAGRPVMTARLKDYREVETPAGPRPVMPMDIRIDWPDSRAGVHILLSDATTAKGKPEACQPDFPAGIETIQVDRNIQPAGGKP